MSKEEGERVSRERREKFLSYIVKQEIGTSLTPTEVRKGAGVSCTGRQYWNTIRHLHNMNFIKRLENGYIVVL